MAKSRAVARRRFYPRFKRTHSRPKMTIPLAVVAGFVPVVVGVWNRRNSGTEIGNYLQSSFTGVGSDGKFNLQNLKTGLLPIGAGFIVHTLAGKLGINRAIARARIPFLRI